MEIAQLSALSNQTSAASTATTQLSADFDTFLTLLTAQLQNQDPLEPLDTEQFTQQLVQFSGVEQSIQTNQNLETLIALQSSSNLQAAVSTVGSVATLASDTAGLVNGQATWLYSPQSEVAQISLQIRDQTGSVVREFTVNDPGLGPQSLVWDGLDENGLRVDGNAFRLEATGTDASGNTIPVTIESRGVVDAVAFDDAGPLLEIAGQTFSLDLLARLERATNR